MHDLSCAEVQDAAPGFALDILEPDARADVAAHLIRCPGCRGEVTDMQRSAAELLQGDLVSPWPDAESSDRDSAGDWTGGDWTRSDWTDSDWVDPDLPPVRPARRRIRVVITMAAAALLLVGTAFGPELEQEAHQTVKPASTAILVADDQPVGAVYFFSGRPPAIELKVTGMAGATELTCEVVAVDGTVLRLGTFRLYSGRAGWYGTEKYSATDLSSVLLIDGTGHVVASASVS